MIRLLSRLGVAGTPETAALSAVYAVTSPDAEGGRLYGPSRFGNLSGPPAQQELYGPLQGLEDGQRIWKVGERMGGVAVAP